jgi:hypothetical protein
MDVDVAQEAGRGGSGTGVVGEADAAEARPKAGGASRRYSWGELGRWLARVIILVRNPSSPGSER